MICARVDKFTRRIAPRSCADARMSGARTSQRDVPTNGPDTARLRGNFRLQISGDVPYSPNYGPLETGRISNPLFTLRHRCYFGGRGFYPAAGGQGGSGGFGKPVVAGGG